MIDALRWMRQRQPRGPPPRCEVAAQRRLGRHVTLEPHSDRRRDRAGGHRLRCPPGSRSSMRRMKGLDLIRKCRVVLLGPPDRRGPSIRDLADLVMRRSGDRHGYHRGARWESAGAPQRTAARRPRTRAWGPAGRRSPPQAEMLGALPKTTPGWAAVVAAAHTPGKPWARAIVGAISMSAASSATVTSGLMHSSPS